MELVLKKEEVAIFENLIKMGMSEEEAEQTILDDRDDFIGEDGEQMTQEAKKIMGTIHGAEKDGATKERKKVEREIKPDLEKRKIIKHIAEMMGKLENVENVVPTNIQKIIEFDLDNEHYVIDLKRTRKPKK